MRNFVMGVLLAIVATMLFWQPSEFTDKEGVCRRTSGTLLFYYAVARAGWGSVFSFKAVVVTIAYLGILVGVAFVTVVLEAKGVDRERV